ADYNLLGFNYRMTDIQGAIGLTQLRKLDRFISERQKWAEYYRRELAGIPWLQLPEAQEEYRHGWQAFTCYVEESKAPIGRNEMMERLQAAGISTRPGTHAVHMLGYYQKKLGVRPEDFPVARDCDRYTMAIPLHNRMSGEDFQYVVDQLKALR